MKKIYNLVAKFVRQTLISKTLLSVTIVAQTVSLTGPVRQPNGSARVTMHGVSPTPVNLQATADFKSWNTLQTFTLTGIPQTYTDPNPHPRRFYRLVGQGTAPAPLPELALSPNAVFPAGEGFDTVQYAPNGRLAYIFWKGRDLLIRERANGSWTEQKVTSGGNLFQLNISRQDYKFQPAALLLYDANSNPHVFKANANTTISHFVRSGAAWTQSELITDSAANAGIGQLVGAVGPNNVFHLAAVTSSDTPNLTYGSNRNGQWTWTKIADVGAFPRTYLSPSYAPRWFSMAVDSANAAHIVFRPAHQLTYHAQGYVRAYNELHYASNRSGQWRTTVVHKPADASGEAGNGISVAIGNDGKPYIASWYNERADTGSAQWSRLLFHQQDASGNWQNSIVLSRPEANYQAGDGEKGTGFAPYLRFDAAGRAHIIFTDHASEHFWNSGQNEYAGQIRHAWWNGSAWQFETLVSQTAPLQNQMIYPAFAMNGSEIAVTGLQRQTQWNQEVYPPVPTSTYKFTFLTKPLR